MFVGYCHRDGAQYLHIYSFGENIEPAIHSLSSGPCFDLNQVVSAPSPGLACLSHAGRRLSCIMFRDMIQTVPAVGLFKYVVILCFDAQSLSF